jgi:hypothetical protein
MLQTFAAIVEAAHSNAPPPIPGFAERLRAAHPPLGFLTKPQGFDARERRPPFITARALKELGVPLPDPDPSES